MSEIILGLSQQSTGFLPFTRCFNFKITPYTQKKTQSQKLVASGPCDLPCLTFNANVKPSKFYPTFYRRTARHSFVLRIRYERIKQRQNKTSEFKTFRFRCRTSQKTVIIFYITFVCEFFIAFLFNKIFIQSILSSAF